MIKWRFSVFFCLSQIKLAYRKNKFFEFYWLLSDLFSIHHIRSGKREQFFDCFGKKPAAKRWKKTHDIFRISYTMYAWSFFPPLNIEASSNLNKEWIYHWRKTKSKWDRILFPKVRIFQSKFQFYAKLFILLKPNECRTKTLWGIYVVSEVFLSFEK